jgi:hypothetical protein
MAKGGAMINTETARRPRLQRGMKRCNQCNGRFGLLRHRLALKQFCSKACLQRYKADAERTLSRTIAWVAFLAGRL